MCIDTYMYMNGRQGTERNDRGTYILSIPSPRAQHFDHSRNIGHIMFPIYVYVNIYIYINIQIDKGLKGIIEVHTYYQLTFVYRPTLVNTYQDIFSKTYLNAYLV
jgi:hypothetical protein